MSTSTATRERPILFSGPMVTAILEGRKSVTRRVVKPLCNPMEADAGRAFRMFDGRVYAETRINERESRRFTKWGAPLRDGRWCEVRVGCGPKGEGNPLTCPYGEPGERLWVREAFTEFVERHRPPRWAYRASVSDDGEEIRKQYIAAGYPYQWKPSIHMPRVASRIDLEVVSVRVERLQEITEEDAIAEGVEPVCRICGANCVNWGGCGCYQPDHWLEFCRLWDVLNGKTFPWASNPWVYRVEFRRVEV